MKAKQNFIKVLKINEKGRAEYLKIKNKENIKSNSYHLINRIKREDILNLLEYLLENDFNYDPEEDDIVNEADKIIYSHLVRSILDFESNKETIKDSVDSEFEEFEKQL